MKLLIFLMTFGLLATEAYAAQAYCTAQARAPRTYSEHTVYRVPPHSNVKQALKKACRKALRKCKQKARRPRNCQTLQAYVKFPALIGRNQIGGRGGW